MPRTPTATRKLLALAVSALLTALVLGGAFLWLRHRREVPTVQLVDGVPDIAQLLELRKSTAPRRASDTYPPPLLREIVDEATARAICGQLMRRNDFVFDPMLMMRRIGPRSRHVTFAEHEAGGWEVVTNSLGMREDSEPLAVVPELRVLVTGDSHTDGLCPNHDSFTNVLERELSGRDPTRTVEALNCGTGGFNPYGYLGLLEHFRYLHSRVFIAVVYGGNDFDELLLLERYYDRRGAPLHAEYQVGEISARHPEVAKQIAQEIGQVLYFLDNPGDVDIALDTLASISVEMERICKEDGTRFLAVYLPPAFAVQRGLFASEFAAVRAAAEFDDSALSISDTCADRWLAFLATRGIASLDLRPALRAASEACYWHTDLHVNVAGHRVIAAALLPAVEALLR